MSSQTIDVATQGLSRPAAVMAAGTAVSRLTGLGRILAMAFALGVTESRLADSYNVANTLPNVLYELVLGGVLTSVFIPVIVEELRTRAPAEAWRTVSVLVSVAVTVLAAVSVLVVVAAPWIIEVFTARVGGTEARQQQELATFLLRWFAPQIALYGLIAIAEGLLNAHGRFAAPAFAPIANNLVVIASFVAFGAVVMGTPTDASVGADGLQKLLLGAGTTGGVVAMALVLLPFVRRLPGRIRYVVDLHHPVVGKLARLSAWAIVYVVTNAAGFVVSFVLANQVQGGPTAYVTAFAFFQLPIGIAAISVITALTPQLSAHHVDGDEPAFRSRLASGLRGLTMLMLPATVAYLVLAHPLIELLLEHGVVGAGSTDLVASVLAYLAIGLLPFSAFLLFTRGFYARQDARTPALLNVVENGVTVALDLALFPLMKIQGLALAHTLGYVVGSIIAGFVLARRLGGLELRRTIRQGLKVAVASGSAGGVMLIASLAVGAVGDGLGTALLQLVVAGGLGVVAFVAAARVLRIEELAVVERLVPRRRGGA